MGFSRDQAEQALVSCNNDLAAATEWILTHPLPSSITAPSSSATSTTQVSTNKYSIRINFTINFVRKIFNLNFNHIINFYQNFI